MNISFRLIDSNDLPLISLWQITPEVREWYGKEYASREQIEKHYQEELEELPRLTWHYIIQLDDIDAGMIQTYLLSSYPDMDQYIRAGESTAVVDVFLASPFMHKGYGSRIMKAFLKSIVFSSTLFFAKKCAIGPEPKNLSAIRMYEKAGFRWIKTVQIPDEDEPEYIMIINKEDSV